MLEPNSKWKVGIFTFCTINLHISQVYKYASYFPSSWQPAVIDCIENTVLE